MKFTKKKALVSVLFTAALCASLALFGCSGGSSDDKKAESEEAPATEEVTTIRVGASPTPHAEILADAVAPVLADKGYELEVVEFTDYVLPNTAVEEGEIDANYFQHKPYLEQFNDENGTHLVDVASVHFEPMGIYAASAESLEDIAEGATVVVPNDTTNEARALLLLEQEGLITLKDGAGITATVNDIAENPKNLKIVEVEAASVPLQADDANVAIVVANANYALDADLVNKGHEQLAVEAADGEAAQTYENVLVVKEGSENDEAIKALAEAMNDPSVREYIVNTYNGAVLPVF